MAATLTLGANRVTAATPLRAAWIGGVRPEGLIGDSGPACVPALAAARPFLGGA
jgi:hypothetical protein